MSIEVRRAAQRYVTREAGTVSWHCFSHGEHLDPDNLDFGALVALNEDLVGPGAGFDTHAHADTEIVTWVLSGRMRHADDAGREGVLAAGDVQRTSAGAGVQHSERNASGSDPVRVLASWLRPDDTGTPPVYERATAEAAALTKGWVALAAGAATGVPGLVGLGRGDAVLWATRLPVERTVVVPTAPYVHLLVVDGTAEVDGAGEVEAGDAVRCVEAGPRRARAITPVTLACWQMHSDGRPPR